MGSGSVMVNGGVYINNDGIETFLKNIKDISDSFDNIQKRIKNVKNSLENDFDGITPTIIDYAQVCVDLSDKLKKNADYIHTKSQKIVKIADDAEINALAQFDALEAIKQRIAALLASVGSFITPFYALGAGVGLGSVIGGLLGGSSGNSDNIVYETAFVEESKVKARPTDNVFGITSECRDDGQLSYDVGEYAEPVDERNFFQKYCLDPLADIFSFFPERAREIKNEFVMYDEQNVVKNINTNTASLKDTGLSTSFSTSYMDGKEYNWFGGYWDENGNGVKDNDDDTLMVGNGYYQTTGSNSKGLGFALGCNAFNYIAIDSDRDDTLKLNYKIVGADAGAYVGADGINLEVSTYVAKASIVNKHTIADNDWITWDVGVDAVAGASAKAGLNWDNGKFSSNLKFGGGFVPYTSLSIDFKKLGKNIENKINEAVSNFDLVELISDLSDVRKDHSGLFEKKSKQPEGSLIK